MSQKFLCLLLLHSIALFCSFIQPGDRTISISIGWCSPHCRCDTTYCHHQTKNWYQMFVSTITLFVYFNL